LINLIIRPHLRSRPLYKWRRGLFPARPEAVAVLPADQEVSNLHAKSIGFNFFIITDIDEEAELKLDLEPPRCKQVLHGASEKTAHLFASSLE
jgi:hypothetical protein